MKSFDLQAKDGSRISVTKDGSAFKASCSCADFAKGSLCRHIVSLFAADSTDTLLTKESQSVEFDLFDAIPDSLRDLAGDMVAAVEDFAAAKDHLDKTASKLRKKLGMPPPLPG